jgi:lysozyme
MNISEQLVRDEGVRLTAYRDTVGKLTIGIGHNLDDKPISKRAALAILEDDIEDARQALYQKLPWTVNLDEARRGVLINMEFNMGIGGLLGFKNTLAMIQSGEYESAARAMLESHWAQQVGARATRLAEQMRTGEWQ